MSNHNMKSSYSKPTLIEYGSLAERTKIFGMNPEDPEAITITPGGVSITLSGITIVIKL